MRATRSRSRSRSAFLEFVLQLPELLNFDFGEQASLANPSEDVGGGRRGCGGEEHGGHLLGLSGEVLVAAPRRYHLPAGFDQVAVQIIRHASVGNSANVTLQ